MSPYIVTVTESDPLGPKDMFEIVVSRHAVATLDEARRYVEGTQEDCLEAKQYQRLHTQLAQIPESGGTIGPLPDGTVIEVVGAKEKEETPTKEDSQ